MACSHFPELSLRVTQNKHFKAFLLFDFVLLLFSVSLNSSSAASRDADRKSITSNQSMKKTLSTITSHHGNDDAIQRVLSAFDVARELQGAISNPLYSEVCTRAPFDQKTVRTESAYSNFQDPKPTIFRPIIAAIYPVSFSSTDPSVRQSMRNVRFNPFSLRLDRALLKLRS